LDIVARDTMGGNNPFNGAGSPEVPSRSREPQPSERHEAVPKARALRRRDMASLMR